MPPVPTPRPPDLPAELEPRELDAIVHDATHAEVELNGLSLSDQHAKGATLRAVMATRLDLSGSRLDHLRLVDAQLDGCNLANVRAPHAELMRVAVTAGRLTGLTLANATLQEVTFSDCRVDLATFAASRLTNVTFEDCVLTQTDFLDAQLEGVRFHRCDLGGADFREARLRECELRGCDLTDLQGVQSLRGAAMPWSDIVGMAGVWAAALGIGVLDVE